MTVDLVRIHHVAYRCKDAHETVNFYNKILKFPLAHTLLINETKTKRKVNVLHIFFIGGIINYRFWPFYRFFT